MTTDFDVCGHQSGNGSLERLQYHGPILISLTSVQVICRNIKNRQKINPVWKLLLTIVEQMELLCYTILDFIYNLKSGLLAEQY